MPKIRDMESFHEAELQMYAVRVYLDSINNYDSVCTVFKIGDRGFMTGMNGPRFYEHFSKPGSVDKLLEDFDVDSLEGYCTYEHEVRMHIALEQVARVERLSEGRSSGRPMVWMRVSRKRIPA